MGAYSGVKKCTAIDPKPGTLCQLQHAPYRYIPSLWLGVFFCSLFATLFLLHFLLAIWPGHFRRGGFMLLTVLCCAGEVAGWAARTDSHYNFFQPNPYIAQMVSLVIAPVFLSAATYLVLERIMQSVGHDLARVSTKVYMTFFVSGDIVSLVVQALGGGLSAMGSTQQQVKRGSNIALGGMIIQVFVTGPYLGFLLDFMIRHYRLSKSDNPLRFTQKWTRGLVLLSMACVIATTFILIRCVYRLVEMQEGWTGYLSTHEVWLPIFDAAPIAGALMTFVVLHPAFLIPEEESSRNVKEPPSIVVPMPDPDPVTDSGTTSADTYENKAGYDMYNFHLSSRPVDPQESSTTVRGDPPSPSLLHSKLYGGSSEAHDKYGYGSSDVHGAYDAGTSFDDKLDVLDHYSPYHEARSTDKLASHTALFMSNPGYPSEERYSPFPSPMRSETHYDWYATSSSSPLHRGYQQ